MKKVLFTLALAMAAITTQAQSFRLGLGGGINNTWLANKNVSDQGDKLDFAVSFGGSIGLEGLYNFNEKSGISFGFLYSGHNQKYEGKSGSATQKQQVNMKYLDIPVLFRLTSTSGTYFEVGPQLGLLMAAKDKGDANDGDVKSSFNSTNLAAVLGFGVDVDASESVIISIGLRLGYGFTDVTKEYSASDVPDDIGFSTFSAHFDDKNKFDYKPTNRIFGGLHLGVSYIFPAKGK